MTRSLMARIALSLITVGILSALAGCAPAAADRWFTPPIRWDNGERALTNEASESVTATIALSSDGGGEVIDFPQGTEKKTDEYGYCLDRTGNDTYSGKVRWSNRNKFVVDLKFGSSVVPIQSSSSGEMDKQPDWGGIRIVQCDGTAWAFDVECGVTAFGSPNSPNPQSLPCSIPQSR